MSRAVKMTMPLKGILDRFEGDFALLEVERATEAGHETEIGILQVPTDCLPKGSKEGDVLIQDGTGNWLFQQSETEERRRNIESLMDSLFEET